MFSILVAIAISHQSYIQVGRKGYASWSCFSVPVEAMIKMSVWLTRSRKSMKGERESRQRSSSSTEMYDRRCACAAMRRAARSLTQFYDLVLAPAGIKSTQFFMLRAIHEAGELAQCTMARQHAIAVETLSRRLAALRKKDLVTGRTGDNHGEQIYALTEKGKAVLRTALPYWERAQGRFKQSMGEGEWNLIFRLCDETVKAAREAEQLRTHNADLGVRPRGNQEALG
jgi:DNA-binding MarR family transcriptional regulator